MNFSINFIFDLPRLSVRNANAKPTPICGTIRISSSDKPPGFVNTAPGSFG